MYCVTVCTSDPLVSEACETCAGLMSSVYLACHSYLHRCRVMYCTVVLIVDGKVRGIVCSGVPCESREHVGIGVRRVWVAILVVVLALGVWMC